MQTQKTVLLADLHFGKKKNCEIFLANQLKFFYEAFIPVMKVYKPERLYILGDIFETRNSLSVNVISKVVELFEDLSKTVPNIAVITGNHDIVYNTTLEVSSLSILKHIANVHIISKNTHYANGDYRDFLVPWIIEDSELINLAKTFDSKSRVFGHFAIKGAKMTGSILSDSSITAEIFSKAHSVYSGHFHIRQNINNITYIGSPYQLDRGDSNDIKGFYTLDSDGVKFIPNKTSATFECIAYPDSPENNFIKGNIIDVLVKKEKCREAEFHEYMSKIASMNPLYNATVKIIDDEIQQEEIEIKNKSLTEMLDEYVKTLKIENEKTIIEKIHEYMREYE